MTKSERNSYRRSFHSESPSASSMVTVKGPKSSTSYPRSGLASNHSIGSSDEMASLPRRSSSTSRAISPTNMSKPIINAPESSQGHISKWSQSTTSSHATTEHRRHSSFSKRFSLSSSTNSATHTSPSKKRRPADINTDNLVPRPLLSRSPADQLSAPNNYASLKNHDGLSDGGPRTPLLYIGQISSTDDSRYSPLRSQALRQDRSPGDHNVLLDRPVLKPLQLRPKLPTQSSDSHPSTNGSSGFDNTPKAHNTSPARPKNRKDKDKKSMLSRALQRANDAVHLDNAMDYMGAVQAYEEACEYLSIVTSKTSGQADKEKLSQIKSTYVTRIRELQQLDSQWQPPHTTDTPGSPENQENHVASESFDSNPDQSYVNDDVVEAAKVATIYTSSAPLHEESVPDPPFEDPSGALSLDNSEPGPTLSMNGLDDPGDRDISVTKSTTLALPSTADVPPPLSPRRPPPPIPTEATDSSNNASETQQNYDLRRESNLIGNSAELYATWMDNNGDARPSSRSSSHHSMSSENGLRRKHLRTHSSNTEAEFDAALDAAVEAAYDEGYEPFVEADEHYSRDYLARASLIEPPSQPEEYFAQRNSIIAAAKAHVAQRQSQVQHQMQPSLENVPEPFSGVESDDEEERLLDEVTQDLAMEDESKRGSQAKSNIPRQSDSSASSGRTWGSSIASSLNTTGTSLSTVDEHTAVSPSSHSKQLPPIPPPAPPPTGALPMLPVKEKPQPPAPLPLNNPPQRSTPSLVVPPQSPSVQDRRSSSGQRTKRLKIETTVGRQPEVRSFETALSIPKKPLPSPRPETGSLAAPNGPSTSGSSPHDPGLSASTGSPPSTFPLISAPFPTPFQCNFPDEVGSTMSTPALTSAVSNDSSLYRPSPQSASPINPFQAKGIDHALMKSHSSLSLRQKGLATPPVEGFDTSPGTPRSLTFSQTHGSRPPLSTPVSASTILTPTEGTENAHLFSSDIHALHGGTKAGIQAPHAPRPLEPCPDSPLLRPFWLMRRFYQTIAHPRGGYLSLRIFIPREVWKVKNVKLKNLEDKIANCDLLTAALLKLGKVDTLDADAVLEEMQAFEAVLDQAQANLSKKLGSDVGAGNISSLFKDAPVTSPISGDNRPPTAGDTSSTGGTSQSTKTSSKSYFSSFRKLRNKNSSAALSTLGQKAENMASKDTGATMASIPMTSSWQGASNRIARRDFALGGDEVKTEGPNATYMSAVARLCDAAQVLDQIARQVEDPGLKRSSETHVGLELSSKHAAEFFAFYICRFVLQDITLLADKFIKRASEWVLC